MKGGRNPAFLFNKPLRSGRDFEEIAFHPYHYGFAAMVRVERCGKSAPDGWKLSVAVNSIRSNAVGTHKAGPAVFRRRLERVGNSASR